MRAFTIVFFTVILLCILIGVGGGFHMAFMLAKGKPPPPRKNKTIDGGPKQHKPKKRWLDRPWASKDKGLSSKIHKQDGQSFAEFDCQFTGEDPDDKLKQARGAQDNSYNCLNKETKT